MQGHVKENKDKLAKEKRLVVNLQMLPNDKTLLEQRSDPAKECAKIFSHATTEKFEIANQDSQNYTCEEMTLTEDQLNRGVTCAHSVTRRTLAGKDDPPPPRVVEEINSIKYCSCKKDVNRGEPDKHIQCVLGGAFDKLQFNDHFKLSVNVPIAPRNVVSRSDILEDSEDENGDIDIVQCEDGTSTPLDDHNEVNMLGLEEGAADEGDGVGEFVSDYVGMAGTSNIELPSQSLSKVTRHARSKTKKMTGMDKYNAIMDEAKLLAGIVSQEKSKDFAKARNVLKFVRTNIQNMGGDVLVAAASDYLGLKNQKKSTASNADKYGLLNDEEILAPVLKKSAGRTSTKRKNPSTEGNAGTTSNDGHACSLCSLKGHKKMIVQLEIQ